MESQYFQMIGNLLLVLILILVAAYFLKRAQGAKNQGKQKIDILNHTRIGSKERILLLEVNERQILIGVTPSAIQTLFVFDQHDHVSKDTEFQDVIRSINA